jgi:hypothetical protein
MEFLKELYRKDPRRWIPTVGIIVFFVILLVFSILDGFLVLWPGWGVWVLMTGGYTWNLIWEYKQRNRRWPRL